MVYFTLSDIHGDYNAMRTALNNTGYEKNNPNHQIIVCGDMFGRAQVNKTDCINIWKYLTSDMHNNKPICLRGNHETILIEALKRHQLEMLDCYNGEHKTFASFIGCSASVMVYDYYIQFEAAKIMWNCGFANWLQELPWYFETRHCIFVHGFLPLDKDGNFITEGFEKVSNNDWHEASWTHTLNALQDFKISYPNGIGKTIVFGHWTTKDLIEKYNDTAAEYGDLFRNEQMDLIGLDTTTALTHKVLCAVIED